MQSACASCPVSQLNTGRLQERSPHLSKISAMGVLSGMFPAFCAVAALCCATKQVSAYEESHKTVTYSPHSGPPGALIFPMCHPSAATGFPGVCFIGIFHHRDPSARLFARGLMRLRGYQFDSVHDAAMTCAPRPSIARAIAVLLATRAGAVFAPGRSRAITHARTQPPPLQDTYMSRKIAQMVS